MDSSSFCCENEFSALTRDPVARNMIRTLFLNRGKTTRDEIMSDEGARQLKQRCEQAYISQGRQMASEGIRPGLIENAAHAVGMRSGPLELANENADHYSSNQELVDVELVKQRLMCAQALEAAVSWENGLTDPIKADLVSILGWGFPSYTGGVLSYIDTMGINEFISVCDHLREQTTADLNPSSWLRQQAQKTNRVYPPIQ